MGEALARSTLPKHAPVPTPDAPSFRIVHASDLHFGKIAHEKVVPALVEEVNAGGFDLVVLSGDLTQRARRREYEAARAMVEAFGPPALVVPGNHDVPPWWRPLERILRPGRRFRRYFGDEEAPSFEQDGLAAFGLNSSHGLTIKGGKIRRRDLARMQRFFAGQEPGTFKVLAVHHHLTRLRALGSHDVARGAAMALEAAASGGVDLVLCGHLHVSHVASIDTDVKLGRRLVVASAGTATSSRGRQSNRNVNFYNHVTVAPGHFEVEERRFEPAASRFVRARTTRFEREVSPDTGLREYVIT